MRPRAIATPGAQPVLAVSGAAAAPGSMNTPPNGGIALSSLNVADAERVLIQHALAAADNNRTKAADMLGISVRTLRNKLNGPGRENDEE